MSTHGVSQPTANVQGRLARVLACGQARCVPTSVTQEELRAHTSPLSRRDSSRDSEDARSAASTSLQDTVDLQRRIVELERENQELVDNQRRLINDCEEALAERDEVAAKERDERDEVIEGLEEALDTWEKGAEEGREFEEEQAAIDTLKLELMRRQADPKEDPKEVDRLRRSILERSIEYQKKAEKAVLENEEEDARRDLERRAQG